MRKSQFFLLNSYEFSLHPKRVSIAGMILALSFLMFSPSPDVQALSQEVPSLIAPANNSLVTATGYNHSLARPPVAIPIFHWTAIFGATSYRIQLSQDIAFTTKIEFTTPYTKFTPPNVSQINDGTWYWRVRVDAPYQGNYSNTATFIKQWASPDNTPLLLSPANQEAIDFNEKGSFAWEPVIGAAAYRFQIASSENGFSTPLYNQTTLATSHQPTTKLANGTYYWRVIPIDSANREGTVSEVRKFILSYGSLGDFPLEIPALLEPLDKDHPNYTPPTFTPTFRWTAVRGAQYYRLQYTSDPTCNFGNASLTKTIDTRNTSYIPTESLPNDVNYCWRVRAHSGNAISDWSETWEFLKQWYIQAVPLTPVNNYQYTKWPFFSWTPVPGAAYYKIQIRGDNTFPSPINDGIITTNPYYTDPDFNWAPAGTPKIWYWRVTPFDGDKNAGKPSDGNPSPNPMSFTINYESRTPHLYYPPYYYEPNNYPSTIEDIAMNPHEDASVALPIFIWHRVFDLAGNEAKAYKIQVDDDPLFLSLDWEYETENLSATPTILAPFNPPLQTNHTYYWRVCSMEAIGGGCVSPWSQIWVTQINPSKMFSSTSTITLLRPMDTTEFVEMTPLLEWFPLQNADSYRVQISQDANFNDTIVDEMVTYPAFAPAVSLARRSLNKMDFGTYYWRVRGYKGAESLGGWSAAWRFIVSAQSQWRQQRTLGEANNRLQIGSDAVDIADQNYELVNLYAAQDKDYWYFGFNAYTDANDMEYGLYLDLDRIDNSGATTDPRGNNISTIALHRPEYAIYIRQSGGEFSEDNVILYRWASSQWANNPQTLDSVGGSLTYIDNSYLEIRVPNTAIGMGEETSSISLSLFSIDLSDHTAQDCVPSSTNLSLLERFASVSERPNLGTPPNKGDTDPTTYPAVPPFFFEHPINTPWEGYTIQIALDQRFTTEKRLYQLTTSGNTPYLAPPFYTEHTKTQDIDGDNTYYWRVRPQYSVTPDSIIAGAWSQPKRFERQGFVPQNLRESITFATPTFAWDIAEGAESYDFQVDSDPNFGTPDININTANNSYTPLNTLPNGKYYWRVRIRRYTLNESGNDWSSAESFSLTLPQPTGLTPNDPDGLNIVTGIPTLCWDPLIVSKSDVPVMAAYKYKVQVSKGDPTFSTIYDSIETEQVCWTPTKGYDDGKYYWRVAMMDGNSPSRQGDYSSAAVFTKQYPAAIPNNTMLGNTLYDSPTFAWTAVDGMTPYVHGAASYRLEISKSSTYTPLYDSITTNNTDYIPTKKYEFNQTYYWRVAIIDKDGKYGPFSNEVLIPSILFLPTVIRSP